jgi:peptidase M23-like protein
MVINNEPCLRVLVSRCIAIIATAIVVAAAAQEPRTRIDVRVGVAPTPFSGTDGLTHLAYELIVTRPAGANGARFERVEVFGESDPKPLISYASSDLDQRVMRPEADPKVRYGRLVASGTTALIHVWITLLKDQAVPHTLRHSFGISAEDGSAVFAGEARVEVHSATPPIVGRPFRAGAWLAHNGPGQHRSPHWGSALVDERGARIPQRYAIDFIGVDENGSAVRGDVRKSTNEDWTGFGSEILAVVDGVVHAARDGLADNQPLVEPPPPASPSVSDTYGNYVIIAVDDHTFVHYAHLQRNSVTVKTGQRVRRGQVIGRLGNSGNTNGPHLHFNITDGPSHEATQGVPFVFDAFESLGRTTPDIALGAEPSSERPRFSPSKRGKELPLDATVVRFP